jgi:hypothetical protein
MKYSAHFVRFWSPSRRLLAATALAMGLCLLPSVATADNTPDATTIDRPDFSMEYPAAWREDVAAGDYNADNNFTLNSPKNSYIEFKISDKTDDLSRLVNNTVKTVDGPAITTVSKENIYKWGHIDGLGVRLKGKILGSFPGGIVVFSYNDDVANRNVLIVEYYFSDELKDLLKDIQFISEKFVLKKSAVG